MEVCEGLARGRRPTATSSRRSMVGHAEDLNKANTRWGKHLAREESPPPNWVDVAALRSRIIFGGALQRCLQAAGKPALP